jgi:hypothetical protein
MSGADYAYLQKLSVIVGEFTVKSCKNASVRFTISFVMYQLEKCVMDFIKLYHSVV